MTQALQYAASPGPGTLPGSCCPRDMAALPHTAGPGGLPRQPVVGAHGLASLSSAAQAQPRLRLEQVCPAGPATVTRVPDHHDILAMPLALQPPAVGTPLQLAGTPKGSPVFLDMCPNPPPTLSPGHPALPRPLRQPLAGGGHCPRTGTPQRGLWGGVGLRRGRTMLPGEPSLLLHCRCADSCPHPTCGSQRPAPS